MINGSPNKNGCVGAALEEVKKTLNEEDVKKDLEGPQTMRNLGRNMAFLIRAIAAEKEKSGMPAQETDIFTSFPDGL